VKKLRCVLSIPGDALYLRAQKAAAKATADRLGVDLQIVSAEMDAVAQGQELLELVQSRTEPRLDGILLEPVSSNGLARVAEAAIAAGIGWVVSNAQVEYIGALREKAKVPVFLVTQDHVEVGRIQGRQIAALLPEGGSVLYLRGPAMSSVASLRFEGVDGAKPKNVELKSLKVQGSTQEAACKTVSSWLSLSTVHAESTQLIMSQNVDFILGARKAFEKDASQAERSKWLALPCGGVGVSSQVKPLVDQGVLSAAVVTSLTMDRALEMLVKAIRDGSQPPEHTFVEADQYPNLQELAQRGKAVRALRRGAATT
jgi:ABC-type sugar transport system substrate-binding protein